MGGGYPLDAMADVIQTKIAALRALLLAELDPRALAEQIPPMLRDLRGLYPTHRADFSRADIQALKLAAQAAEAAEDFADLLEGIPDVRVHAEAADFLDALSEAEAVLHDAAIGQRVRRELRALRERFPGAAVKAAAAARVHRIRALEARAWPCRCGEALTLRGSDSSFYWGCSTFPRCRYTHQLTDQQLAFLRGD